MESTFVRKDFYIDPPDENADPKEWAAWLKKDTRKAAAHKRAYTMSFEHVEAPEELQNGYMRKVGGVWKQSVAVGFSGDAESDQGCTVEPIVDSKQEQEVILCRMGIHLHKPSSKSKGKSARRRKNKKARRKG